MSSGRLDPAQQRALFCWQADLPAADYVFADYQLGLCGDGMAAAIGLAMEQSAACTRLDGYLDPGALARWSIRVVSLSPLTEASAPAVAAYHLPTEVYPEPGTCQHWHCRLAIPKQLVGNSYTQLLNVVVGEIPRLGFVRAFRLSGLDGLDDFGPGPGWGIAGLREHFGVASGPLLCRSMRPAVGLDRASMARLNHDVLCAGFHAVKDDELMFFARRKDYAAHVAAMTAARDQAQRHSGERKAYIATLLCDADELPARWQICIDAGVDAVLLAPHLQGISQLAQLAAQRRLPILAHNTCGELLSRHPAWSVAEPVWLQLLRRAGADLLVTPGGFGDQFPATADDRLAWQALHAPHPGIRPSLPILQGGKAPAGLARYRACCAGDDYLLIVASWIDQHAAGPAAGARVFRQALDRHTA